MLFLLRSFISCERSEYDFFSLSAASFFSFWALFSIFALPLITIGDASRNDGDIDLDETPLLRFLVVVSCSAFSFGSELLVIGLEAGFTATTIIGDSSSDALAVFCSSPPPLLLLLLSLDVFSIHFFLLLFFLCFAFLFFSLLPFVFFLLLVFFFFFSFKSFLSEIKRYTVF